MSVTDDIERNRLVDIEAVKQWLDVRSDNTVKRYVQRRLLAEPRRLSRRCVRWTVGDLIDCSNALRDQPCSESNNINKNDDDNRPRTPTDASSPTSPRRRPHRVETRPSRQR